MNKSLVLTGITCFIAGIGCGFLAVPKVSDIRPVQPVLKELTSQGRAEVRKMIAGINAVLAENLGEITAENTRALQAITAKEPDRAAAEFYLAGMEDKKKAVQTKIDKILLDAIQNMPLIDRRTYMKFYMKNRSLLKLHGILLPFMTTADFNDE